MKKNVDCRGSPRDAAAAGGAVAQDAKTVVANASKAMGADGLTSIIFYGSGANYNLGQTNNANSPWPQTQPQRLRARHRLHVSRRRAPRAVDLCGAGHRRPRPSQAQFQQNITPARPRRWAQQLEIWTTPWGFLKGAAANNATAQAADRRRQALPGGHVDDAPMKSPGGQAYKRGRLHQRRRTWSRRSQTWLENPIFGDMLVETEYTYYRDANGLKYPAEIVQKRGGWPAFDAADPGRRRESRQDRRQLHDAAAAAGRPRWRSAARRRRRLPPARPGVGEAGRRRVPHQRRVQLAGGRVRRPHPAVRARPAERGARAGEHRRGEARHSRASRSATA